MFNLGFPELLVVAAAALLVFGPKRLPELGKALGNCVREFKKGLEADEKSSEATVAVNPVADHRAVPKGPAPQES